MAAHTRGLTAQDARKHDARAPEAPEQRTTVRIRNLVRSFAERRVLDGLELDVTAGEFVALIGRSGSGKSTLLRALAGLDHQVAGSGELDVPEQVSVVFQDARLLPWKRLLDNVILGLDAQDARRQGREVLEEVGLGDREEAWPRELSGGEQQRVSLARSLVREPQLLLADEPFGALDALTRLRMHTLLRRMCERHRPTVLLVTHDVDEAIALADRIVVLDGGRIGAEVPVESRTQRRHGSDAYVRLRERLLRQLGVHVDEDEEGTVPDGEPDGHEPDGELAPNAVELPARTEEAVTA